MPKRAEGFTLPASEPGSPRAFCGFIGMAAAQAADMGVPSRSYYPPLPPAIYDWIGIYVGGHIGGGMLWLTP
jgi:hypothetical protein